VLRLAPHYVSVPRAKPVTPGALTGVAQRQNSRTSGRHKSGSNGRKSESNDPRMNRRLVARSGGPNPVVLVGVDENASRERRYDAIKWQAT
jgi:hypothetical protein